MIKTCLGSVLFLIVECLVTNRKMLGCTVAGGFIAKCKVWCVQLYYNNTWHIPKFQAMLAGRQANRVLGCHTTEKHKRVLIIIDVFIAAPNHSLDNHSVLSLKETQIKGMTRNRNNTKNSIFKQTYIFWQPGPIKVSDVAGLSWCKT